MTLPIGGISSAMAQLDRLRMGGESGGIGGNGSGLGIGGGLGTDTGVRTSVPVVGAPSGGPSFGDTLKRAINEVSDSKDRATDYVDRFTRGEPVELHQVMAATEEAGIALEMLVELRNKFTEAYRTLVSMQS
jgi:flagellar hook-basal body complex protein FliE